MSNATVMSLDVNFGMASSTHFRGFHVPPTLEDTGSAMNR